MEGVIQVLSPYYCHRSTAFNHFVHHLQEQILSPFQGKNILSKATDALARTKNPCKLQSF